ncbi:MAG: hypothetical protein R2786_05090 [Flavobacteriaceae bacterium]
MHFIQSNVYSNLYLIKYPEKNQTLLQKAIKEKIIEHFQTEHKMEKKLAYTGDNGIYFYEYTNGFSFDGFLEAGTAHFIENEEDPGGFVSEELNMYTQFQLADFYFEPCKTDSTLYCGEINYLKERELVAIDSIQQLTINKTHIK